MAENPVYAHVFLKHWEKRIKLNSTLAKRFDMRVRLFLANPKHPLLRDHQLTGEKSNLRAFSVTGDVRIIYRILVDGRYLFLDVGTHNQVY